MGASASNSESGSGIGFDCCVRRGDHNICDLNDSIFGEDAFYREAFHDCDEGNISHDWLFEQARLKMRKGNVLMRYTSFELSKRAENAKEGVKGALAQCVVHAHEKEDETRRFKDPSAKAAGASSWLGTTIPEWTAQGLPATGEGPYWSKGDGKDLRVRCGPDYVKQGHKTDSSPAMYQAISCDTIKSHIKTENIIGRHIDAKSMPTLFAHSSNGDISGGASLQWKEGCPLPRVICINMMMPYATGLNPFHKDAGCSFVGLFEIKPETLKAAMSDKPPAHVELFRKFWEGPAGKPGCPNTDLDRCLAQRMVKGVKKDQQPGLFKAVAKCVNPQDVNVPDILHQYNGKPCLITKCGYVIKDPAGEWMEIGIDVRGFNVLARKMLCSFRNMLPRTKIHYGFLIQGVEDEELPEGLLCDMYCHGINMMDNPRFLEEPEAGS